MDSCPYCGEMLDGPVAVCPRCDAVLDDDAAGGGGLVGLDDDEIEADDWDDVDAAPRKQRKQRKARGGGRKAKVPTEPCPHCDKPVKANKHRCPHCGKGVRDLVSDEVVREHRRYQSSVKLGALLVVGGGVLLLVVVIWLWAGGDDPPAKKSYLKNVKLATLAEQYGEKSRVPASKREKMWERSHKGKFITVVGHVTDADGGGLFSQGFVEIDAEGGKAGMVRIRATLANGEDLNGAMVGSRVRIEGQLTAYGGEPLFALEHGRVLDVLD